MSLVPSSILLSVAYRERFALPAFNFGNFDVLFGVFSAAESTGSPVLVQTTQPALEHLGLRNVVSVVKNEAERSGLPTALHLDHGEDIDFIFKVIEAGFTSVMFDGASMTLDKNIEKTLEVVNFARKNNVTVEGEVGIIGHTSDGCVKEQYTDADIAKSYIEETGVDILAISVGSVHGMRNTDGALDLKLLESIQERTKVPLVLHGSSGVSNEDITKAVKLGVVKTNIETRLRVAYRESLFNYLLCHPTEIKSRNIMAHVQKAIFDVAVERQSVLQCIGKAKQF